MEVTTTAPEHYVVWFDNRMAVALDTEVTEELKLEGLARDVVRQVQQLRKDTGLNMEDRIELVCQTSDEELMHAIATWREYICAETLCVQMTDKTAEATLKTVEVGGKELHLWLKRHEG